MENIINKFMKKSSMKNQKNARNKNKNQKVFSKKKELEHKSKY